MDKEALQAAVLEALQRLGGEATIIAVARDIWDHKETELRAAGDLFYTWQYDMRWAAQELQRKGLLHKDKTGTRSIWRLL